ncbi:hypothetical protein [Desulfosporosinus sp. BG]|uniref:hypothetical protein n=1 Tax=Desulfosporosinus sp. BG TaxID=1633135 RepID=UPI00159F1662|nr:hypothetical protein [Desulfosporosinus sp. BG]
MDIRGGKIFICSINFHTRLRVVETQCQMPWIRQNTAAQAQGANGTESPKSGIGQF